MIMLQFANDNPIAKQENIELCERYDSSLIHYENHEKFDFLKVKAQSVIRRLANTTSSESKKDDQINQFINPFDQSKDMIFIG